jgi:hypothetical protein
MGIRSPTSHIVLRVRTTPFRLEVGLLRKSCCYCQFDRDGLCAHVSDQMVGK